MAKEPVEVEDPDQLRALAHPARWRVLTELYAGRTLTATAAAALCGLSASAMSYHLNLLARHGLIVRDDDSEDGRERPWRAGGDALHIDGQPEPETGRVMMAGIADQIRRLMLSDPPDDATDRVGRWPASYTGGRLRLRTDQAKRLHEAVRSVIEEFEGEEEPAGPDAPALYEFFWVQGIARS